MGILDKVTKRGEKSTPAKAEVKKVTSKKTSKKVKKVQAHIHSSAFKVLASPHVTEKAARLESNGTYVFKVSINSTKGDIAKAITHVYGTKPVKVRVMNVLGDKSRSGHNNRKPATYKKAIVTLKKGDSIQIYEGV